ncbi:gluconokinase [Amycolatopsis endophytica]|uniref:Gluconokinase n=1 Tax=Amycolatopsis endophytica TaxID=860233 RepID=A0A853AXQ8_9PSEU|nr:gluconokinase [Amycolatopsis endophytica]NYI87405.1 gluconokinase [Amycolatopsis endophytica]
MTVIVVMGVAGSGKTTVGSALAGRLGVVYAEADQFHPAANIEKMSSGHPLNDEDRQPWLHAIAAWISEHQDSGGVVSSSALKRRYRDVLRTGGDVWFLHLDGPRDILAERMRGRSGHFMPVSLLDSQLADLEPLETDERGMIADISEPPTGIVDRALTELAKEQP